MGGLLGDELYPGLALRCRLSLKKIGQHPWRVLPDYGFDVRRTENREQRTENREQRTENRLLP